MWVFHEALCSPHLQSSPAETPLPLFVVYGCLSLQLSPKSSEWKRRRGLFLLSLLSGLTFTFIIFIASVGLQDNFLYFLSIHPIIFKPSVFTVLFHSSIPFLHSCRCPQPVTKGGTCQQPRCIYYFLPLWYPWYGRWSTWGLVSCRGKVVSTVGQQPKRGFWGLRL